MISFSILIDVVVFLFASGTTFFFLSWYETRGRRLITENRLGNKKRAPAQHGDHPVSPSLNRFALTLGQVAAPKNGKEISKIKAQLCHAGHREEGAVTVYYGFKLGGGIFLAVLFFLFQVAFGMVSTRTPLMLFIPFGTGYFLPDMILKNRVKARICRISQELPDTLDLLVTCLYAGLGFDYALFRVCNELKDIAPVLSKEFGRYFLETKSGLVRETALKNLADRNGSEPLKSVVSVLLQSSKIGTDMARALKIYTDTMRKERQQMAEEQGAKLGTKLTLPLVVFILPALMFIILGPVIINFVTLIADGF
ncbi:MAG: type II secretion system F family protein [Desulfobacterium sp.]|nr:type II secretion system F family protein [Desulfobacterium sp.]